ncbi:unnamed protein product [Adineta steineri]|uniref:PDZ domain-containing protein n=1 Tax=Adineta steineri TaxID=433720 RepID=A0A814TZF6_9BILA|nr:unnamed protein product [Adineta steineri]
MTTHTTRSNQSLKQTDDDDNAVEPEETRHVTISEAIGLDFNSFIPQADITSQVHFISNIQADSEPSLAGLKNGDRILQINGINITSFEYEDVRKLMQLMTPIVLTVANDPKYLTLLQEPIHDIEEKQPCDDVDSDPNQRRISRFELKKQPSFESLASSTSTAIMIRAAALASNQVELTVISKLDIPEYKTLQEKGLIDWSIMGLER